MLTIRLQRAGKKNKADFRLVLAEKTAASQKKFIEVLGSYNPHTKTLGIRNPERLNYWIDEQHVEISPTVRNLLITKDVIKGNKSKAFTIPKKEVVAEEPAQAPEVSAEPTAEPAVETEATPEAAESTEETTSADSTETQAEAAPSDTKTSEPTEPAEPTESEPANA